MERIPTGPFTDRYRHFDAVANRLVGLYRGSFLASYSLGVVAVFLALLGHLAPVYETVWSIAEITAIAIVFAIVLTVLNQRLHYRSVDCRYLAEQFRVLCHVYPLALTAPRLRLPAHLSKDRGQMSWMEWRLRALLRQTPMPSAVVSEAYLAERQNEVLNDWIWGQVLYHERNHARMHCVESRLDVMVWVFAVYVAIGCIAHVFHFIDSPWLLLYTAGLPAAAAACHAIATQGELRRLSERSEALSHALREIQKDLPAKARNSVATLRVLREAAQEAATLMVEEVADWQILYRKPLPPP